jgi:hypothetical protein
MHPVVSMRCQWSDYSKLDIQNLTETGLKTKVTFLNVNGVSPGSLTDFGQLTNPIFNITGSILENKSNQTSGKVAWPVMYYPPLWVASPEPGSSSLLGIFSVCQSENITSSTLPRSLSQATTQIDSGTINSCLRFKVCTLSSYWNIGEIQLVKETGIGAARTHTLPMSKPYSARKITLDVTGIAAMHSSDFSRNLDNLFSGYSTDPLSEILAISIAYVPITSDSLPNNGEIRAVKSRGISTTGMS